MAESFSGCNGANISGARNLLRLTQKNLARALEKILKKKVTQGLISRIEDGATRGPKIQLVRGAMIAFFIEKGIETDAAGDLIFVKK